MRASLFILFGIGLAGCISAASSHNSSVEVKYHSTVGTVRLTDLPKPPLPKYVGEYLFKKNICIDPAFNHIDRMAFTQAITQWNHALGGRIILTYNREGCDWHIVSLVVDENYASSANRTTLAFANAIGGDTINIIRVRIGNDETKLERVTMHEIGHLLGVDHPTDMQGLMAEYYSPGYASIDSRTLNSVLKIHHIK
jgi:hypothetical protein